MTTDEKLMQVIQDMADKMSIMESKMLLIDQKQDAQLEKLEEINQRVQAYAQNQLENYLKSLSGVSLEMYSQMETMQKADKLDMDDLLKAKEMLEHTLNDMVGLLNDNGITEVIQDAITSTERQQSILDNISTIKADVDEVKEKLEEHHQESEKGLVALAEMSVTNATSIAKVGDIATSVGDSVANVGDSVASVADSVSTNMNAIVRVTDLGTKILKGVNALWNDTSDIKRLDKIIQITDDTRVTANKINNAMQYVPKNF
jgi:hypothetical protein